MKIKSAPNKSRLPFPVWLNFYESGVLLGLSGRVEEGVCKVKEEGTYHVMTFTTN